jgi:hypothetical protein
MLKQYSREKKEERLNIRIRKSDLDELNELVALMSKNPDYAYYKISQSDAVQCAVTVYLQQLKEPLEVEKKNFNPLISVLFVRLDSIYKRLGVDAWDMHRDARNWDGNCPVIAHPPCRGWGKLRHFAKPATDEKELALFAVDKIRIHGGILEHPQGSLLFKDLLPLPGKTDSWGGYTVEIDQFDFGHKAQKRTWLYIVGLPIDQFPFIPERKEMPMYVVASSGRKTGKRAYKKRLSIAEREETPEQFAKFLIDLAYKILANKKELSA